MKDITAVLGGNPLFMLSGLTLKDEGAILSQDSSIMDEEHNGKSEFISGIKFKTNGELAAKSQVYTQEEFNNLKEEARRQIKIAVEKIREGKFEIAPVRFDKQDDEDNYFCCKFCNAQDICFMKNDDIKKIKKKEAK